MKHRKEEEAQKKRGKDRGLKILALIYLIAMLAIIFFTAAEVGAKTREPEFTSLTKTADGEHWEGQHLFIVKGGKIQTGWVRYKGHTYYCHKTDSQKYPRGSATRGEMKIRNGKFYAFAGADCRMLTKDYYIRKGRFKKRLSLKINKDGSVRYVYNTSACFGYRRYNCKERRYQDSQPDNTWKTVPGMQFIPDYVDTQK